MKGYAWRVFAEADVGRARRSFSKVDHFNVSDTSTGPRSYGLALADTSQSALVLAPSVGVEWTGDRFSIGSPQIIMTHCTTGCLAAAATGLFSGLFA